MKKVQKNRNYDKLFQQFWPLYVSRPIQNNSGGCELPQLFGLWCFLRENRPTHIIESGAWKGQTAWLMEQTLPNARIMSIDPVPENRIFTSPNIEYSTIDLTYQDLSAFPPTTTCVFEDDHINHLARLHLLRSWGIRWWIVEDNYPDGCGDPSLRQMLAGAPAGDHPHTWRAKLKSVMRKYAARFDDLGQIYDPKEAQAILSNVAACYEEFPPLAIAEKTRWGTQWQESYPDHRPVLNRDYLTDLQRSAVERTVRDWNSIAMIDFEASV